MKVLTADDPIFAEPFSLLSASQGHEFVRKGGRVVTTDGRGHVSLPQVQQAVPAVVAIGPACPTEPGKSDSHTE